MKLLQLFKKEVINLDRIRQKAYSKLVLPSTLRKRGDIKSAIKLDSIAVSLFSNPNYSETSKLVYWNLVDPRDMIYLTDFF